MPEALNEPDSVANPSLVAERQGILGKPALSGEDKDTTFKMLPAQVAREGNDNPCGEVPPNRVVLKYDRGPFTGLLRSPDRV